MDALTPYRVLARKYRPASFEDLIGQEPMVKTLSNSFTSNRIAQAWLLTGVRGVGKTTTARILARGLNYQTDRVDKPTIEMPSLGYHCAAIMESRHVDVIEMDAASNTGISDIREIIESARYRPASARYKVFIIDEVHMLSTAAFNGLLKTLEEPPAHVKFIFATTEIRKVPITVLSRCQRFDLRRIEQPVLINHLKKIIALEHLEAEDEALALIARASEGSVRDSLSLTDQAIAHSAGQITAQSVQEMLGLADKNKLIDLFAAFIKGDFKEALICFREQYDLGADPASLFSELADFTHFVTRLKLVPENTAHNEPAGIRGLEFAGVLSIRVLSRLFTLLMKGIDEVKASPKPLQSAEMVLIRLCHAADLPSPEEVIKAFQAKQVKGETSLVTTATTTLNPRAQLATSPQPEAATQTIMAIRSLEDIAALASVHRELSLKIEIETNIHFVAIKEGHLEITLTLEAAPTLANTLSKKLKEWTGRPWLVTVSQEKGEDTLANKRNVQQQEMQTVAETHPLVIAALELFKGAEIINVHTIMPETLVFDEGESEGLAAIEEEL